MQSDVSAPSTKRNGVASRQAALSSMAQAPLKNVAMMCFMMWMSGSQLHLFSIMTTASGFYQPLSAILKSGEGGSMRVCLEGVGSWWGREGKMGVRGWVDVWVMPWGGREKLSSQHACAWQESAGVLSVGMERKIPAASLHVPAAVGAHGPPSALHPQSSPPTRRARWTH